MKTNLFPAALLLVLIVGCNNSKVAPKVTYDENKKEAKKLVSEVTTEIEIADLPIQMEGSRYLLHPIGTIRVGANDKRYGENSYKLSNYNRLELTGNFTNLKFQHQDSITTRNLTDKNIKIQTATLINAGKKQFLIYILEDLDSNKDGELNDNDIKDLYLSDGNGLNFVKLSADMQEVIDWNTIESKNKLFFRTLEDINKNGAFDSKDQVHYFYLDLDSKQPTSIEYFPVDVTQNSAK